MRGDELDTKLRAWGAAQTGRHAVAHDRHDTPGSHPIARARQFAPMTRAKASVKLLGRDGCTRRRLMAQKVGMKRLRVVPTWAVDPVPCKETRHMGPAQSAIDVGIPPDLRLIDQVAMELYRANTLRGLCLRIEYTAVGPHSEKAKLVARAMKMPEESLSVRTYREELRLAREYLRCRGLTVT